jgi:DNA-binding response OmpR family regulator
MPALEKPVKAPARLRALVVDDDPGFRNSLRLVLSQDYDVVEAESIEESIVAFEKQPPDFITLDINMPGMSGMEGLDLFRHRAPRIPIILISGYHTFELAREALRLGANDYLTKPFSVEDLLKTVRSTLAKVGRDDDADTDFMVRLPLKNLKQDEFLSERHLGHFLVFAQSALAKKERALETISVDELVKTIDIQFEALRLAHNLVSEIAQPNPKSRIACDMYLLGGALANLALTCVMATAGDKSPLKLVFDDSSGKLRVLFQKASLSLPKTLRDSFEKWHQDPNASLDASTAMLVLAEKVVALHHGEFTIIPSSSSGTLLEISLPLKPGTGK